MSDVVIITTDADKVGFKLDIKRCYLPFVVSSTCPGCGLRIARHLRTDYLSYPALFTPSEVHFIHEVEEPGYRVCAEWSVEVVLEVSLKVAP